MLPHINLSFPLCTSPNQRKYLNHFAILVTIYSLEWLRRLSGHIDCVLIFCYNEQYCDEHLCTHDRHLLD